MGSEKSDFVMRQKIYGGTVSVPRAVIDEMHRKVPNFGRRIAPVYKMLRINWPMTNQPPTARDIIKHLHLMVDRLDLIQLAINIEGFAQYRASYGGLDVVVQVDHEEDIETWACMTQWATNAETLYTPSQDKEAT